MIRLRDDDVLVPSRSWRDPFGRFRQVHAWIANCPQAIHVAGIIVEELKDFPECIEFIRAETREGRMLPEYHAMFHVDPQPLSFPVIREHLDEGCQWIEKEFGRRPEKWYTPWGADSEKLRAAAQEAGLELVGVDKHWKLDRTLNRLCEADIADPRLHLKGREISFHWWEGGARVARLCAIARHGALELARQYERELFR